MRWVALVLVIANLAFWARSQGAAQAQNAQSDAERVARQVRAQAITVAPLTDAQARSAAR